jgi:hypothetical protein
MASARNARLRQLMAAFVRHTRRWRASISRLSLRTRCTARQSAAPLARLAYDKTAGNPFFVIRFLHALA